MSLTNILTVSVCLMLLMLLPERMVDGQEREPSLLLDPREEYAPNVLVSPDGKKVIYASRRLRTGELDFATGETIRHLKLDEPALSKGITPWAIRLFSEGQRILTTDLKVWNRISGKGEPIIALPISAATVDISENGK